MQVTLVRANAIQVYFQQRNGFAFPVQQELCWPVVQSQVLRALPMRPAGIPVFIHPQQVQRPTDSSVTTGPEALVSGLIPYQLRTVMVFTSIF